EHTVDHERVIQGYHAHVYFRSPEERVLALTLREWIGTRFPTPGLGRVPDVPIGPHSEPMYQVAFERDVFAEFVPWLMVNHRDLSVLIHPNTGRARDDHLVHALWLGGGLLVRAEVLSNEP